MKIGSFRFETPVEFFNQAIVREIKDLCPLVHRLEAVFWIWDTDRKTEKLIFQSLWAAVVDNEQKLETSAVVRSEVYIGSGKIGAVVDMALATGRWFDNFFPLLDGPVREAMFYNVIHDMRYYIGNHYYKEKRRPEKKSL